MLYIASVFFVVLSTARAYTINTQKNFTCAKMELSSINGYRDEGGDYIDLPSYIGPLYTCTIAKNTSLTYYFANPSLGLGYNTFSSPSSWTIFFGMDEGVTFFYNTYSVNGTSFFESRLIKSPPLFVTYVNSGSSDSMLFLPSIFVAVQSTSGQSKTGAIIGTTVLAITFVAVLAIFRSFTVM